MASIQVHINNKRDFLRERVQNTSDATTVINEAKQFLENLNFEEISTSKNKRTIRYRYKSVIGNKFVAVKFIALRNRNFIDSLLEVYSQKASNGQMDVDKIFDDNFKADSSIINDIKEKYEILKNRSRTFRILGI